MGGELEDGTLTVGTGGDAADVGWVVDCSNDAGCEDDFLPGLVLESVWSAIDEETLVDGTNNDK